MADAAPPVLRHSPHSPPLVGRAREQALLHERLAATLAGHEGIVLIGGEAGIGKTALAVEVGQAAAERGALVLTGHCYDLTETPPYGPWLDAFARYPTDGALPPLPAPLAERGRLGAVTSQEELFGQMRDFLSAVAAARPLVLLLDDLHWSDPASLDLLRLVARDRTAHSLLLLITYRSDELLPGHPLATLVPRLVREAHGERLDLRPLDEPAVRALVMAQYALAEPDLARLVAYLQARAEGNPFYLSELLRSLTESRLLRAADSGWALGDLAAAPVPPLLRQVVAERAARLGGAAQRLLALAAVIGQEIPLGLWGAVGEVAEDALLDIVEPAVEAHLLAAPDGRRVRFVHALVREALYEGLLPPRRRAWHQRAGEALAALPQSDPDAVAYHFQQAGDPRAVDWLLQAGERAQRAYAFLSAAESFATALRLLPETPAHARDRCWLLLQLAWLRRFVDPWQGIALCDDACHLATAHGDPALIAHALGGRGMLRQRTGDCRRGLADLFAAAKMFADLGEQHRLVAPSFVVTQSWAIRGSGPPTLQQAMIGRYDAVLAREDWPRPRRAAEDCAQGAAWSDGTIEGQALAHAALGDPRAARREFARFCEQARENGHYFALAVALADELNTVLLPYAADRPAECQAQAATAAAAWQRASTVQEEQLPLLPSLSLQFLAGDWATVRAAAPALASGRVVDWQRHQIGIVGALAAAQGDGALLDRLIRDRLPGGPATEPETCWILPALALQRLAATRALDLGDHALARAWLAAHDRWLAWSGTIQGLAEGLLGWAAVHRATGDPILARERAEQALARASAPRQPLALLAAHRLLGEVDISAGRYADAQEHLDTALALADTCAAPYERALTLLTLAERDYVAGNYTAALAPLEAARAILAPLKAAPALTRADRLAAQLACLKPAAPAYPCGLTVREGEVLRLLAAGRSNREIATALFVSPRTVERHLEAIYRKIEARNRTEASAFAFRHHLT
jgi:DNA-binding CsgD family transcriptional regulator